MTTPGRFPVITSASGALRIEAALAFLRQFPANQPVTIVGASRGAADDLARRAARERGATLGLARFSLTQLAARLAAPALAGRGIAPSTALGAEAVAARAAFEAVREGALTYFDGVARTPGFPRALARSAGELRLMRVPLERVGAAGAPGRDLADLLARIDAETERAGVADQARLLAAAADAVENESWLRAPLLLLDVPVDSAAEEAFIVALVAAAMRGAGGRVCATVPLHDDASASALQRIGGVLDRRDERGDGDLPSLRRFLFEDAAPLPRTRDGSLEFFSAPGEGRECVEIVRRLLREAKRGVPFDEMAIFLRASHQYASLLEQALARAGIPGWFDRGTRRPHPAGRAFLALLACAAEGLSARRFAEYLSLGEIPGPRHDSAGWVSSADEVFGSLSSLREEEDVAPAEAAEEEEPPSPDGTLPAPRRWEWLLVEAAVVGGDPARWEARLDGLRAELVAQRAEAIREDAASPRAAAIERDLERLVRLREFALPIVRELAAWPRSARWGEWLEVLERLAPAVLRTPGRVLRVLADLRPMAAVGPVALDEVRLVLADRLRSVESEPPSQRYGRVFVGTPAQARGRTFRVVFVPGLAERMFPHKPQQDPLLLDSVRARLDPRLPTRADRGSRERLLLRLAVGAAVERLYVSYPRLEIAEGRARVPSFYALDLLRGATGRIPGHDELAAAAAAAGDPTLAWPAPADPAEAIDDQEHDLAVLRRLLDAPDAAAVRGHAHYMLRLNAALRRSVTERWARGERRWSPFDGLMRVTDATRDALARHRLGARPYSLSSLQRFAVCPYQFLLGAIYRLHPAERPEPIRRLDPLTRGSIVHRMQAEVLRALQARGALPVTPATYDEALPVLENVVERVAREYHERLVPAIERVWQEEIAQMARDLRGWLRRIADEGAEWHPRHFELAFGIPPDNAAHDPGSVAEAVTIDGRFRLRGAVDLVEEHRATGLLRVTDHKTGKDRTRDGFVIDGGRMLQPVLYSMAVERVLGRTVGESRLFFCTAAGGYKVKPVPVTAEARRMAVEALEIIDRAIEAGMLAAAPAEGACAWCDFRPVCGPNEEPRTRRKPKDRLRDLIELRSRP